MCTMTVDGNMYPCPWCDVQRPRTSDPCPECGHVDTASVLPHHVHGLPGGDAVAHAPAVIKVLVVLLVVWLVLTLAFIVKYG